MLSWRQSLLRAKKMTWIPSQIRPLTPNLPLLLTESPYLHSLPPTGPNLKQKLLQGA
jgi:hypothetical protein